MAQDSKIEWTHHTCNLWHGCTEVQNHGGCDHCYARVLNHRWGYNNWGNDNPRRAIKNVWNDFEKYQKLAKEKNEVHRVFVGSMMDIFEKPMPLVDSKGNKMEGTTDDLRQKYFNEVIPATPNLIHLLLTKRPSNINKYIPEKWKYLQYKNIMFGTSPVNKETYKTLTTQLLQVKGKRFLSIEPLLEDLGEIDLTGIDWVIVGGESGHGRRPFNTDWAHNILRQCRKQKVAFFMKQIDKIIPVPDELMIREFPA